MSKVVSSQYENDLVFNVDYLVENEVYNPWRQRLFSQILSTVEVPGFRKGKAPEHLALKQLNLMSVEETILQETISKFGTEALNEAKEKLTADKRVVQSQTVNFEPEYTGQTEEGFKFRLVFNLLPVVDLAPLENIKSPKIAPKDLPQRITKDEFISQEQSKFLASLNTYTETDQEAQAGCRINLDLVEEVAGAEPRDIKDITYTLGTGEIPKDFETSLAGLKGGDKKDFSLKIPTQSGGKKTTTVKYKAEVKKVLSPEYKNLEDLFANSESAKKQFENRAKFEEFLANYYDQETKVIEEDVKKRQIIQETLKVVSDFHLPIDRTEAEQNRILKALQEQATTSNRSLGEVFRESGIDENPQNKIVEDPIEIRKLINTYVDKEFKWIFILRNIYELKVENKISNEQLETVAHEMEKKPEEYNIAAGAEHNYYHEVAYDRLMRSRATSWLFSLVEKNEKDVEVQ